MKCHLSSSSSGSNKSTGSDDCLWRRVVRIRQVLVLAILLGTCCPLVVAAHSDFVFTETTLTKLAFGSCHKRKYANPRIWQSIQQQLQSPEAVPLQAWLWTGDAVYPPKRGIASVPLLREEYKQMKQNDTIGYKSFLSMNDNNNVSVFGTWDDHDYGGNDMGRNMPDRQARADAFWDFLGHKSPPLVSSSDSMSSSSSSYLQEQGTNQPRSGVYYSVEWGEVPRQVKVIFVDTRWHRADHCIPSVSTKIPLGNGIACGTRWLTAGLLPTLCKAVSGTLLGEEQWMWLEKELKESKASVNLLVSSIQVLTTSPVMESWGHFPKERERLVRAMSNVSGAVILSGDVHHAELLDPSPHRQDSPFLEVTSSGMTHDCSDPFYGSLCGPLLDLFHRHRHNHSKNYFIGRNFGTLSIDWENQKLQVNVHDTDGNLVLTTNPRSFRYPPLTEQEIQHVAPCMDGHLIPLALSVITMSAISIVFLSRSSKRT